MEQGKVQVYTGDGKGKTTAAVGLAVRAAGNGLNVYFGQFMKHGETGELEAFGTGDELSAPDPQRDAQAARHGLACARVAMASGNYDVVILDEANVAEMLGYFAPGALLDAVRERPEGVELVITGRGASDEVMAAADLVTEMREVKHYYRDGVPARRGIEF